MIKKICSLALLLAFCTPVFAVEKVAVIDVQKVVNKSAQVKKYEKELSAKREANAKVYKTKLEAIDKTISATINNYAKTNGYDLVIVKGAVLYGGDDITEAVSKVVK